MSANYHTLHQARPPVSVVALTGGLAVAAVLYWRVARPWHLRWGATDAEVAESLPGDEFVPQPRMTCTHAITVDAPPEAVWPWLVQLGQDKAGFYSYRWLENLAGCQMPASEEIVGPFQHIAVGDRVWLHPKAPPLPVVRVEPERSIVFGSNSTDPGTWAMHLKPLTENRTRLIIRGRGTFPPGALKWFTKYAVFEPIHFLMEQKMMRTVKRLAENEDRKLSCRAPKRSARKDDRSGSSADGQLSRKTSTE